MESPAKRQRNHEIYILRKAGMTYVDLAYLYDVSTERIRQICVRESEHEKFDSYDILYEAIKKAVKELDMDEYMANRVIKTLIQRGIAAQIYDGRTISSFSDRYLLKQKGIWKKSLAVIREAERWYEDDKRARKALSS